MNYTSTVIGYPYIGENREWKKHLESFWKNNLTEHAFLEEMKKLRLSHLRKQQSLGINMLTVGDFTFYDRMLDTAVMFSLVPKRYGWKDRNVDFKTYYAMARGAENTVACEMTKWFNTNYHYIVPEFENQRLHLTENRLLAWFTEAKEELGLITKPTLIGPYTFMKLTKGYEQTGLQSFASELLPLYIQVIQELASAGAEWIQLEEPSLVSTIPQEDIALVQDMYKKLKAEVPEIKVMLQTYFEAFSSYKEVTQLPVDGIGLDFVHGHAENIASIRDCGFPSEKTLGIGILNGRDIWRADTAELAETVREIVQLSGAKNYWIQPSCSLQHVPVAKTSEQNLNPTLENALSFANEKIIELKQITSFVEKPKSNEKNVSACKYALEEMAKHAARNNQAVETELRQLTEADFNRPLPFEERKVLQQQSLDLPLFPTTTIGSFPQSDEVRRIRRAWRMNDISDESYDAFLAQETERWIAIQEEIGLDVLVHGEFERTDMVEYFGEKLAGFAFTENGWVVSYGSRCVKPPIIYGDVEWLHPMTVKETAYAQKMTTRFVKGMLTGPVTILNWSFVRDDLPRKDVANQIALALRKEIRSLEDAGISIVQVDEPALREGLPLRKEDWNEYLDWSVKAFRLATSQVQNETQVHTHMCYCEFNDFIEPIRALDADIISIETSRSHGELIESLKVTPYDKGIGLGVYDIHSPRVPAVEEMLAIMHDSLQVLDNHQFWINPDCGLKTRKETETIASLKNMVTATKELRKEVSGILA